MDSFFSYRVLMTRVSLYALHITMQGGPIYRAPFFTPGPTKNPLLPFFRHPLSDLELRYTVHTYGVHVPEQGIGEKTPLENVTNREKIPGSSYS
jgi:hypothetical protein